MTSRNSNWNHKEPLLLSPAGKDYIWGGTRLKTEFDKNFDLDKLAETWECSTHQDGMSTIVNGEYAGKSLAEVLEMYPDWLGTHPKSREGIPILIKLIDAAQDLSVQVHPDDEYALDKEGQLGKTEMWYVLDAAPGSRLAYGFVHDMTREQVLESIKNNNLTDYLQYVPVHKGDVFYIEPGTIHAIGAGVLIAEIQESSNVTYRVFDYNRIDKKGEKRKLHIEEALNVLNYKEASQFRQPMRVMRYTLQSAKEMLARCRYFQVEHILVGGEYKLIVGNNSFKVFLCLDGDGYVIASSGATKIRKGDCIFLPAGIGEISLRGNLDMLQVEC